MPETVAGFGTPDAVFAAYTQVLNRAEFCKAIGFYQAEAQVDAALSAFRAMVLLAGAQSAHQREYQKHFMVICNHYGLNYEDPSAFVGLFLSLLNDEDWRGNIPNVRAVVEADPASFYLHVMERLHSVAPSETVPIDSALSGMTFDAEVATASATRRDGKLVSISFRQAPQGWLLSKSEVGRH